MSNLPVGCQIRMKRLTNTARKIALFFLMLMAVSFVAFLVLWGTGRPITGERMMEASAVIEGSLSPEDLNTIMNLKLQIVEANYHSETNRTSLIFRCKVKDYYAIESQLWSTLRNYSWWPGMDYFEYVSDIYSRNATNALLLSPAIGFLGTLVIHTVLKSKQIKVSSLLRSTKPA